MPSPDVSVKVLRLPHGLEHPVPTYESGAAVGLDLRAALPAPVELRSLERALIPTGIALEVPEGFEGQVRPRSGLALNQGLTVLNTPGTIDSDYRGEIKVILINLGQGVVRINPGQRVAQLVLAPVVRARLREVSELADSGRGPGGFGHTGTQ